MIHQQMARLRAEPATFGAWLAVALVGLVALWGSITFDFTDQQLAGDQASFVLQTLSLANERNLSYGVEDLAAWRALEWPQGDHPYGLHLQQNEHGWAFAKPYGYSLLAAPVVWLVGPVPGFAIVNTLLLVSLFVLVAAIVALRYSGPVVPVVAGVYAFGSHTVFWAYPVTTDLFLAVGVAMVVYGVLVSIRGASIGPLLVAAAISGFLFTEKITLVLAFGPLLAVGVWHLHGRSKQALVGLVFVATAVVAMMPYLYYSDGTSWTAYGGDRYVLVGPAPFEPGVPSSPQAAGTSEPFELGFVVNQLTGVGTDTLHATMTYLVGSHTGLLVFMPIALAIVALSLAHIRASDRLVSGALLVGIGAYVALYLVVLTTNYFGGGQSIGNRYFLQISPLVIGLLAAVTIPVRQVTGAALGSLVLTLALIPHHYRHPDRAFWRVTETSDLQELLPFESTQSNADFLRGRR